VETERTSKDQVTIRLNYDESLVLSDMLSRWDNNGDHVPLPLEHPAERKIICELSASFDPIIDELFNADYRAAIDAATLRLSDPT
jgi:hypothetical protein